VAADDPKSPAEGNYPKTPHLPFSPGVNPDDTRISDCKHLLEAEVVVTEKWLNCSESQIAIHSGHFWPESLEDDFLGDSIASFQFRQSHVGVSPNLETPR